MPFKGDRRLGGARRNDSTLNGMSDGPDFPLAGVVLGTFTNYIYDANEGGAVASGSVTIDGQEYGFSEASQTCTVDQVADGQGGDYLDWSNVRDVAYRTPDDAIQGLPNWTAPTSLWVSELDANYENGTSTNYYVHDGNGYITTASGQYSFEPYNTFIGERQVDITSVYNDNTYVIGQQTEVFKHDGNGGYYMEAGTTYYYPDGTQVGSSSGNTQVEIPWNGGYEYFNNGNYDNQIYTDGLGGFYESGTTTYYPSGGEITNNGTDMAWYHDGSGGYYTAPWSPPSCPPNGDFASGPHTEINYIEIEGQNYSNGTFTYDLFHDGNCGTYSANTMYYYEPAGTVFFQRQETDGEGNEYTLYFKSDGNGSYYADTV